MKRATDRARSFMSYLKVWTRHTLGQLPKQRLHDFNELRRLDDVQDFFQLIQKHHLFRAVCLGPELQQAHNHLRTKRGRQIAEKAVSASSS